MHMAVLVGQRRFVRDEIRFDKTRGFDCRGCAKYEATNRATSAVASVERRMDSLPFTNELFAALDVSGADEPT